MQTNVVNAFSFIVIIWIICVIMGVHGLWRLLENTGKPVNPETLEGKILAVDISIWLNQAVKGVRDRDGNSVQNAHLLSLFHRICKLLFFRIKPVFVFDGDAPLLKKQTLVLRRQRKEELSRESKQTNEKLLRTFLKRQAIKAALGDSSQEPLPSLSSVRRNEVDDMYVLPALPPAEEKDKSSSEEEEEEAEGETSGNYHTYQNEFYEDPNSVDINSEEFASLPSEMKHEILKEMKEFSKRRRTMLHKPPERSGDFSQYQLAGLLQRNKLNQRLEGVEKEMSQRTAGRAPQLYGDQQCHNVEAQRLVSEDHSHYILIKGSSKQEKASESPPAAAPWSGSSLSGYNKRAADKPEPLWRPVCEEQDKTWGPVLQDKTQTSKPSEMSLNSQENTSPPSPRTLKAIQAALNDNLNEETEDAKDGSVSPRTLLAIQQALVVEEDDIEGQELKTHGHSQQCVPQVTISSSEEEPDSNELVVGSILHSSKGKESAGLNVKDSLLVSSSDDEIEEAIGQRNKALCFAAQSCELSTKSEKLNVQLLSEEELARKELLQSINTDREIIEQREMQKNTETANNKSWTELPASVFFSNESRKSSREKTLSQPIVQGEMSTKSIKQDENEVYVKPKDDEESESEESFIEVSEEERSLEESESSDEIKEEEVETRAAGLTETPTGPADVSKYEDNEDNFQKDEDDEVKEKTEMQPPAANEWDHLDMDELEALQSSLHVEQNNLREQKQQQERMANTVTGQMYLESQELLRLFGVPYLVAPMEAEAQCAALDRADHTHGTITDDSDVWLFGGRHVYRNFFSQNKYVEHYQYSDLQHQLGLDRTKLINLAYLLGSDYTEGVPGVGYVTGMEILNEFPGLGLEPLIQLSNWWYEAQEKKRLTKNPKDTKVKRKIRELKLQPGFPNPAVAQAYLHPAVDHSDSSFSWGRPQLDLIKEFCLNRFGWSARKTEETLHPVMKQLNMQQTQLRIDSFFRMELNEKQAIRSQRLRRAVICMKRKEREGGGGGEEEDTEEEMLSPSKSRKSTTSSPRQEPGEEQSTVAGGGFLGSQVMVEPPLTPLKTSPAKAITCSAEESQCFTEKAGSDVTKTRPQKALHGRRSSSSSEDSDSGGEVAMVTAKSVFEGSQRGRGAKSVRGRGRGGTRGKAKGKKQ